jgi:hypothetical protein
MAGDDLKKVARRQSLRIPAAAYNSFIDAAMDYRNRTVGLEANCKQKDTKTGVIYVRNDSGGNLDQFAVLGLDAILIGPADNEQEFRNRVVLKGVKPDKKKHKGRFGILLDPVAAGQLGRAVVAGICQVKLDVSGGDSGPRFAEIKDGVTGNLKAETCGSAVVLWHEGGTGVQWAVVRLGNLPILFPVGLAQSGGSQGDDKKAASWTYNVTDALSGETLAEGVDPTSAPHGWKRPSLGWMTQATFGYAHYNGNGDLVLGWINEMVDQEPCEQS